MNSSRKISPGWTGCSFLPMRFHSVVVVRNLNVVSVAILPHEAHTPLVVDPDAVLSRPVAEKLLQTVTRCRGQVLQFLRCTNHRQLTLRLAFYRFKSLYSLTAKQPLGVCAGGRLNQPVIV